MFQKYLNRVLGSMRIFRLFLLNAIDIKVAMFAVENLDNTAPDLLTPQLLSRQL